MTAAEARLSARQFLLDVRTPGAFADWIAGAVDAGTQVDDLDGHPAAYVFRVTNKLGAYLGYLTVDAVRRDGPVMEFSRNRAPVFTTMADAKASLAASGRMGSPRRQLYVGPLQYALETQIGIESAKTYVPIAELERPVSADQIRGPPAETEALGALGTVHHVISGVPDYQQFEYDYRSTEYNAGTLPAAAGEYATKPYLNAASYASGCAPTSAANVVKYWADHGYPLLDRGKLPMYAPTYDPNAATPSSPAKLKLQKLVNDLHIYYRTSASQDGAGSSYPSDFAPGMLKYASDFGGYDFTATPLYDYDFHYYAYVLEIAADRPVQLGFGGLKVYAPVEFDYGGHAITGVGYDYTPGVTSSQYMIIHDNWPAEPSDVYVQFDGRNVDYTMRFMLAFAPDVPPSNDDFASAVTVSGSSGGVYGISTSATRETGEPKHAGSGKGAAASVWFNWVAPSTGWFAFSTADSCFDTLLNVYTGTSLSALTSISAGDDISKTVRQSQAGFHAEAGTTYRIAVDGYAGAHGAYELSWFPLHTLSGTVRTMEGAAVSGAKVTLSDGHSATTNGSGVFEFDGLFDGAYTLSVSKSGLGFSPASRSVSISGSDVSGLVFIGQSNDDFANAITLTGGCGTVAGSSAGATKESDEPVYGGGASVWFYWTAPSSGKYWFSATGSSYDTLMAVYSGSTLAGLGNVAWNDDYKYPGIRTSALSFTAVAGTTYRICIDGYKPEGGSAATGTYRLAWNSVGKLALTTPSLSVTSPRHGVYFTVTGYASPWFAGTVRVYLYRLVSGVYKAYPKSTSYVTRTVTTSGSRVKYTYKVKVPYAGKWAVRTRYMGGTFATGNWSSYKYFTAR